MADTPKKVSFLFKSTTGNKLVFELLEDAYKGSILVLEKNFLNLSNILDDNQQAQKLLSEQQKAWADKNKPIEQRRYIQEQEIRDLKSEGKHDENKKNIKEQILQLEIQKTKKIHDFKNSVEYSCLTEDIENDNATIAAINNDIKKRIETEFDNLKETWTINHKTEWLKKQEDIWLQERNRDVQKIQNSLDRKTNANKSLEQRKTKLYDGCYRFDEEDIPFTDWCKQQIEIFFSGRQDPKITISLVNHSLKADDLIVDCEFGGGWNTTITIACKTKTSSGKTKNTEYISPLVKQAKKNRSGLAILVTQLEESDNLTMRRNNEGSSQYLECIVCRPELLIVVVSVYLSYFRQKLIINQQSSEKITVDEDKRCQKISEFYEIFETFKKDNQSRLNTIHDKLYSMHEHQKILIGRAKLAKKKIRNEAMQYVSSILDRFEEYEF